MRKHALTLTVACALAACSRERTHDTPEERSGHAAPARPPDETDGLLPEGLRKPAPNAVRLPSGLASLVLSEGHGARPGPFDVVELHYVAWTASGERFHDSRARGEPARTPLDQTIAGWREGIALMEESETRRLWVPAELAYKGREGLPQEDMVFDIELLRVEHRNVPASAPPDLTSPPRTAAKSKSGLSSLVLARGKGTEHPGPYDVVTVHYDGWTEDGTLFDSTHQRGGPATFPLHKAIVGWSEGIAGMVAGEKRRLWIPTSLAYAGREGPQGPLVYDMELLSFRKGAPPPPEPEKAPEPIMALPPQP